MGKSFLAVQAILFILTTTPALAMVGGGDIALKSKGGVVVFSHEAHVDGVKLACTACHDKLGSSTRRLP